MMLVSRLEHVALGGGMNTEELSWWIRMMLKVGAWKSDSPEEKQQLKGFDYMDKSSIGPILKLIEKYDSGHPKTREQNKLALS